MTNADFVLTADADFEDLPRTLRRERDAREREKREREDKERTETERRSARETAESGKDDRLPRPLRSEPSLHAPRKDEFDDDRPLPDYPAATVRRFDVPFVHLMLFLLKAVAASVPALLLLGAIMWGLGQALKIFFPWLLQMQIFIQFPQ